MNGLVFTGDRVYTPAAFEYISGLDSYQCDASIFSE